MKPTKPRPSLPLPEPKVDAEAVVSRASHFGFPLLGPTLPDLGTVECTTCHFYEHGRCRRNPPTGGQWSTVSSYDWCGEWAKRVPKAQSNGEAT